MIDLKAELYRKQEQFKKERLQNSLGYAKTKPLPKKPTIWTKKNAGVQDRNKKDLEARLEEENELEKSRAALKTKSRLYEKMTGENFIPDEESSEMFLVDFEKKAVDKVFEKIEKERRDEELAASNPSEEWVDYVDSLGRSRRCMKKDLAHLQEVDRNLQKHKSSSSEKNLSSLKSSTGDDSLTPQLLSEDMRRELARQKWEAEELEAVQKPGPVHYSDVRHSEIRTHGVGYYQFAQDEDRRQKQMETLDALRDKTLEQRTKREQLKAKRKAVLDARLTKIKQRRNIKTASDKSTEDAAESQVIADDDDTIGPKLEECRDEKSDAESRQLEEQRKQERPVREWDKGKAQEMTWKRKLEDLRDERPEEFAPPSIYYESGNTTVQPAVKGRDKFAPPSSYHNTRPFQTIRDGTASGKTNTSAMESSEGFSYLKNLQPGVPAPISTSADKNAMEHLDSYARTNNRQPKLQGGTKASVNVSSVADIPLPRDRTTRTPSVPQGPEEDYGFHEAAPFTGPCASMSVRQDLNDMQEESENPNVGQQYNPNYCAVGQPVEGEFSPVNLNDTAQITSVVISNDAHDGTSVEGKSSSTISARPVAYDTRLQESRDNCSIANNEDAEFYQSMNDDVKSGSDSISIDGVRLPLNLPLPPMHSHLPPETAPSLSDRMAEIQKNAPKAAHEQLEFNRIAQLGVKNPELDKNHGIPDFTKHVIPKQMDLQPRSSELKTERAFAVPSMRRVSQQLPEKKDYSYQVKFTSDSIGDALKFFRGKADGSPRKSNK